MAVSTIIKCDHKGCIRAVKLEDGLIGWWVVIVTAEEITTSPLVPEDFVEPVGDHYCSMAHATVKIANTMDDVQLAAITKEHNEKAELEIVATVYSQSGDVEKPDENQA